MSDVIKQCAVCNNEIPKIENEYTYTHNPSGRVYTICWKCQNKLNSIIDKTMQEFLGIRLG